jgi:PIN domain nuclease of toxin-antitoxin system
MEARNEPVGLSAMSLRESAKLIQDGRLEIDASLDAWLDSIEFHPLVTILPLTTKIAAESVRLGEDFPRDPADQIIVATARCHGLTLITADNHIRKWGKVNVV